MGDTLISFRESSYLIAEALRPLIKGNEDLVYEVYKSTDMTSTCSQKPKLLRLQ